MLKIEGAKDPDEFIKKYGATRFKLLLDGSSSAAEYAIARLRERHDLTTDEGKVRFLGELANLIAGLPNPVERDIYISRWAGELGVSAEAFRQQVQSQWRKKRTAEQKKQQTADLRPAPQEVEINRKDPQRARNMSAALAEDKLIAALLKNNDFYGFIRERIGPEDFVTDSNRTIFAELCRRLEENRPVSTIVFSEVLDETLMNQFSRLIADSNSLQFDREQVEEYICCILDARMKKSNEEIGEMSREEYSDYLETIAKKKRK